MNQRTWLPGYGRAGGVLKARGFSEILPTLLHILFTVKKKHANVDTVRWLERNSSLPDISAKTVAKLIIYIFSVF